MSMINVLGLYREIPCLICRETRGTVAHHVKSKGSGGPDEKWNLAPLCQFHHTEIHKIGRTTFANKYQAFNLWLINNGWEHSEYLGKWEYHKNQIEMDI